MKYKRKYNNREDGNIVVESEVRKKKLRNVREEIVFFRE